MGKYTAESKDLLKYVGGRENIAAVSHCVTRMRFVLKDVKAADTKAIEALKTVKGTFTQAGQFQVIIGNEVSTYYNDFVAVAGIAIEPENQVLTAPADGVISVVMADSFHACGLTLDNGMELLFHIGLDTVYRKGDGFTPFVKQRDRVKAGDKLIEFDLEKIKKAGHPAVTMMIVVAQGEAGAVRWSSQTDVRANQDRIGTLYEADNESI